MSKLLIQNLSYGDAWLLETLALHRVPINMLAAPEKIISDWLNRGFHGLGNAEIANALSELLNAGLIASYMDGVRELKRFSPHDLALAIDGGLPTVYIGVTELGGRVWETKANANWDRYVENIGWNGKEVELSATSKGRLDEVVANSESCWNVEMRIREGSFRELVPWSPFPWKVLPLAWQVKASYRDAMTKTERVSMDVLRWADSICGVWV